MRTPLVWLSGILFIAAMVALVTLVVPDMWTGFQPSVRHQRAGAFALVFVGLSFLCLILARRARCSQQLKGLLLGLAFVLWGAESFLSTGAATTAMDAAVIAIFVLDLGLVIKGGLGQPDCPER
jgi:hypothetical protein